MGALKEATFVAEHFAGTEIGSSPCRGIGRAAIEASSANPVAQLRRCIVCETNGVMGLSWERVRKRPALARCDAAVRQRRAVVSRRDMVWVRIMGISVLGVWP